MSAGTSTKRTLMQILILFHMYFLFSCHKSSIKLFHCSTKTLKLRRAKSNVTNRFRTILYLKKRISRFEYRFGSIILVHTH